MQIIVGIDVSKDALDACCFPGNEGYQNASGSPVPWDQLDPDKQGQKQSRAKVRLNNAVASRMTLAQLREVDADDEILGWFYAIAERVT